MPRRFLRGVRKFATPIISQENAAFTTFLVAASAVCVVPGFETGALALLGQISFRIICVRPRSVVRGLVPGPGRVSGHRAVAVGIVSVIPRAIAGELVRRVIRVRGRRAVHGLHRQPVEVVIRERSVAQRGI